MASASSPSPFTGLKAKSTNDTSCNWHMVKIATTKAQRKPLLLLAKKKPELAGNEAVDRLTDELNISAKTSLRWKAASTVRTSPLN